jgi:hypothetical protein
MIRRVALTFGSAALAAGLAIPAAAAPPDLNGTWRLDAQRSDDVKARVDAAAGPAQVKSGGASGLTILPELNTRSEVERVEMRDWMMGIADQMDRLEIQQTAEEVKLYLGDDETVRIFYFGREHVRQDSQGRKLKCRARLEGDRLVLEEDGEKGMKLREALTPVPANGWLVHAVRFESPVLKQPLELRLVYVKDKP